MGGSPRGMPPGIPRGIPRGIPWGDPPELINDCNRIRNRMCVVMFARDKYALRNFPMQRSRERCGECPSLSTLSQGSREGDLRLGRFEHALDRKRI